MNSLSIKMRLWLLVVCALLALCIVGAAGIFGMRRGTAATTEMGAHNIPSIIALNRILRAQLEIKIENRNVMLLKDDYQAQQKFTKLLANKKAALAMINKGREAYAALPQAPEEVESWSAINKIWGDWIKGNNVLDDYIDQLAANNSPEKQRDLIAKYQAQVDANGPFAAIAMDAAKKLVEINTEIANTSYKNSDATMDRMATAIYFIAGLALVLVAVFAACIVRSILLPLEQMQKTMRDIERNNDFTLRLHVQGSDELSEASQSFNALIEKVQGSLQEILKGIHQISAATDSLSTTAGQVSSGSAHQSESASAMAAAVEEMTVSISHVSSNANSASELAQNSGKASREGARIIDTTVDEMGAVASLVDETSGVIAELGEQSKQISSIVQVIKEVADQTNLLALNAAIEAARAGEQGRGFAVVADEVRKLAERTTVSAVEIADMIGKIQNSTQEAVERMGDVVRRAASGKDLAGEAGERVREIERSVIEAVAAIHEVSNSLSEQRAASENIAQNVESVSQMSEENSTAAGHTAEAAHQLSALADRMEASARQFKV
ncbi:MAG TPA: methyl-accepting chemotaxis protein [Rhodocyclaceae bacterium]|jgi:methyl-accepting chemotaxis protein|nr:methyl-accepting chemotaxis protein [Rhodocyclaceae bacterium]